MNRIVETRLMCLENTYKFEDNAHVSNIVTDAQGRTAIILDRTIFYPQGGGQPADTGTIQSPNGKYSVVDVRAVGGSVLHYGTFTEGSFLVNEAVHLCIAKDRRLLNARLHSSGHLIDIAMTQLGLTYPASKGYHFPDSPYVEYEGEIDPVAKEKLITDLQRTTNQLIADNMPVRVALTDANGAEQLCGGGLPDYIDKSKPIRIVTIGNHPGCPCAGTHVKELKELGSLTIAKIRTKGQRIRVSYGVD